MCSDFGECKLSSVPSMTDNFFGSPKRHTESGSHPSQDTRMGIERMPYQRRKLVR